MTEKHCKDCCRKFGMGNCGEGHDFVRRPDFFWETMFQIIVYRSGNYKLQITNYKLWCRRRRLISIIFVENTSILHL